ncbi:hypothetical protein WJX74_008069 [Apatococcus lobatus]|uniref:Ricin B lectin domain-containing protein n=1 Tax=Apatococcus lobatus TaxID=904363 RepID=A0AAW1SH95_9CHLO
MSGRSPAAPLYCILLTATSTALLALVRADPPSFYTPTFIPGTYTIASAARPCRPFVSVNADCNANLIDTWFTQDGSGRQVFYIQRISDPNDPNDRDLYTITVSGGRSGCDRNLWSFQRCTGGTDTPDLFFGDDGSYHQYFNILYAGGGTWNIVARDRFRGGAPDGRPCASYLSASDCSSSDLVLRFAATDDGSGLQRWNLDPTFPPAGSNIPVGAPPPPTGTYSLYNADTTGYPFVDVNSQCSDLSIKAGAPGNDQVFKLQLLPGSSDTYTISTTPTTAGRIGCGMSYWSMQGCEGSDTVANRLARLAAMDDSSDLQHWRIAPTPFNAELGLYELVGVGRSTCASYLSLPDYFNPVKDAQFAIGGRGLLWQFFPKPEPGPILQDGNYRIAVNGRNSCDKHLKGPNCDIVNSLPYEAPVLPTFGSDSDPQGIWKLTLVEGLDTYTIVNVYRQSCDQVGPFLSSYDCDQYRGQDNIVDFTGVDTGIYGGKNQHWKISCSQSTGPCSLYSIQNVGRTACRNFLSVQECGGTSYPDLYFNDGSGRQAWQIARA